MQSDPKEIYRITAARTGGNAQVYKDIGNFVMKATVDHIKRPNTLIIKLKGLGFWYLRKKRIDRILSYYPSYYEIEGYSDFCSEYAFLNFQNKQELYKILKARQADYQLYLQKKAEVKLKKDEFHKNNPEGGQQTS